MIFQTDIQDGLALVTINRAPVNAISPEFIDQLRLLCEELNHADVRAVLFESAIPGRFIAGADLSSVLNDDSDEPVPDRIRRTVKAWRKAFYALEQVAAPTLCAISGHCLGGGLEFALSCDIRLMIDDGKAQVGLTETNLGLFPASGGTTRLPRAIGMAKAKEMIFRGRKLTAPDAHAIGLVHEIYAPAEFKEQARLYARQLADGPTVALKAAKAALHAGETDIGWADQLEEDGFIQVVQTADAMEGLTAFWEKRAPKFQGR